MQVQKCDLTLVGVVLLELPGPEQTMVISCSLVSWGTQRALPHSVGFLRVCDKCVGQTSDGVVQVT